MRPSRVLLAARVGPKRNCPTHALAPSRTAHASWMQQSRRCIGLLRFLTNGTDPARLGEAARHVDVLVPGHGAVAEGPEVAARLAADHAYIDALRRGEEPIDARLGPDVDWLSGPHRSNLEQARTR